MRPKERLAAQWDQPMKPPTKYFFTVVISTDNMFFPGSLC